jgi:c-di-GMP-binding flagellar brake protein YcgR
MYDNLSLTAAALGRRQAPRLRLALSMNEYVKDEPCQALARDVSEGGLALQKQVGARRPLVEVVTVEIELPGTNETIWAAAEPRFDTLQRSLQVSGLRFVSMARKHERLIRDYVRERRERLARLLTLRPIVQSRFV